MKKQLFCSKCGKTEHSQWFETCECKEPDFRFETYDEYLDNESKRKEQQQKK